MIALEVTNLRKTFASTVAVDSLTFEVAAGEIFGLIGPNGAGKSTTMMMITGLLPPDDGQIILNGEVFNPRNRKMRATLGIVPQDLSLYPGLTGAQNLRFFGKLYGLKAGRLKKRVDEILKLTGLEEHAEQRMSDYSGGMKRRLNFGVALLHEPRFVVLDEPTIGIDPQSRTHLLEGVRQLGRDGVGVLYATHYMEEVEAVCDRVAIIDHGKMLRQGSLDELLGRKRMHIRIRVAHVTSELMERLRPLADIAQGEDGSLMVTIEDSEDDRGAEMHLRKTHQLRQVLDVLDNAGVPVSAIETHQSTLENLFLQLTGRSLRD